MRYCPHDGYMAGARYEIPADPTEFAIEGLAAVGCNRLRCVRCEIPVRHLDGLRFPESLLPSFYDLPEEQAAAVIEPEEPALRVYFCRCSRWSERDMQALEDDDAESFRASPAVPWRCAGHPPLALPFDFCGIEVRTREELAGAVSRQLRGKEAVDGVWLPRLHARMEDGGPVAAAVAGCLDDPDPDVRERAMRFFLRIEYEPARARLLELLATRRDLFSGVLAETAWRVLAVLLDSNASAREMARAEALGGQGCGTLFEALAERDTEWFLSNARAIVRATPSRAEALFDSFARAPEAYFPGFFGVEAERERVRAAIGEMITLDEALECRGAPLATWDSGEYYSARLRVFSASDAGAMLLKSGPVEPLEMELWNEKAWRLGGRVGASHTHSEVVWVLEDNECGIWNRTRRLVRGNAERILLEGSFVPVQEIASVSSFLDIQPKMVHRGVHCKLKSGRVMLVHEERDDDPPGDPDYSGEAVEWESAWIGDLAADLATWLGVPYMGSNGQVMNARRLEVRSRIHGFAAGLEGVAPAVCEIGTYDDVRIWLQLAADPDVAERGVVTLHTGMKERTWERMFKRGTLPEIVGCLRHFTTPRRVLNARLGGY